MKKYPKISTVCLLLSILWLSNNTYSAQVQASFNFNGTAIYRGCNVDTDSAKQSINMGPIDADLIRSNKKSLPVPVYIKLTKCSMATNFATFVFQGTRDPYHTENVKITGKAQGISLVLTDAKLNKIPLGSNSRQFVQNTENTYTFYAYLEKYTTNNVSFIADEFEATVNFIVNYS